MSLYEKMDPVLRRILDYAFSEARFMNHYYVGTEHLLMGILREGNTEAAAALLQVGVSIEQIRRLIQSVVGKGMQAGTLEGYSLRATRCINRGNDRAKELGVPLGAEILLLSILDEADSVALKMLQQSGVSISRIRERLNHEQVYEGTSESHHSEDKKGSLLAYGVDLNGLAQMGRIDPVVCREDELQRMMQILSRRTKNNPCLIGEPGVGKTALVEGLALRINEGLVPESLKHKRIFALSLSHLLAGARFRGEFEERLVKLLTEIESDDSRQIILFIDEIHTLIGTGSVSGSLDASNMLKPYLARGDIQVIGATTYTEYKKYIERDAALERRFQPLIVKEPSVEQSILILEALKSRYEDHHKVDISKQALESAIHLSQRYIHDRFLPDKAIDVLDEACAGKRLMIPETMNQVHKTEQNLQMIRERKERAIKTFNFEEAAVARDEERICLKALEQERQNNKDVKIPTVQQEDVAKVIARWTGIPTEALIETEKERLLHLETHLESRIVGQSDAILSLSKAIRRMKSGLGNPDKPMGSFLLIGPSGVGKTEIAKALAEALLGDENKLIRLDMTEFSERHSLSRLIGSPPGYVGHEQGGQLTERVRQNPYSVILFDEINKAHEDVSNILLQILDEGFLTDGQGRRVHFRNTLILMTMTFGREDGIKSPLGFGDSSQVSGEAQKKLRMMEALKKEMSAVFINRIDDVLQLNPLTRDNVKKIAELGLERLKIRLNEHGLHLVWNESVLDYLALLGYDEAYGARPLEKVMIKQIEDNIAEAWLSGELQCGSMAYLTIEDEKMRLSGGIL